MQRLSPYAVLKEVASRQPDHDAIVFDDNSRITYGEFAERVTSLAGWLLNEGFVPGEAAGICIRDEINHLVASMAVLCMDTAQISLASHENATTKRALADRVRRDPTDRRDAGSLDGGAAHDRDARNRDRRSFADFDPSCQPPSVRDARSTPSPSIRTPPVRPMCLKPLPFHLSAWTYCQRVTPMMKKNDVSCAPAQSNSTPIGCIVSGCSSPAGVACSCAT